MPSVTFLPNNITVEIAEGASLLEAARLAGVFLETPCGGKGTCRKCIVRMIPADGSGAREVLICQTNATDVPIVIELKSKAYTAEARFEHDHEKDLSQYLPEKIDPLLKKIEINVLPPALLDGLSDMDRFSRAFTEATGRGIVKLPLPVLSVLPQKIREADGNVTVRYYIDHDMASIVDISKEKVYGVAVDIGTTTVALWIVDLDDGKVLASGTAYNDQIQCGLDVISRINYANKYLFELKSRALKTINALISRVCMDTGVERGRICCLSLAGNTTMVHMLLGITPEYIRLSPYTPSVFDAPVYTARQLGLFANKSAPGFFAPAVGSYVGGDITSGLLCTEMTRKNSQETCLFIDIGTNGEITLGNDEFIFACACSAGPAFEGGGIKHGVRAGIGAIERIKIDKETGKIDIQTIGDAAPSGICGSGIISVIAELFRNNIIDSAGKFVSRDGDEKNVEYMLCEGITISETDIDNFIRAKGAIFSACKTMLDSVELSFNDLDKIYVAGGFGRYLDLEDARTIGLLPQIQDEKFVFLGNTSVIGAYLSLVSEERRNRVFETAGRITYVDLSNEPGYMDQYMAALFLPHTDSKLF